MYHSECYSKFTKSSSLIEDYLEYLSLITCIIVSATVNRTSFKTKTKAEISTMMTTRSNIRPSESNTNILPATCIFCDKKRKKNKQKWEDLSKCESYEAEASIRRAAKDLNDKNLLLKIGDYEFGDGPDFTAMEVQYHHQPCRKEYINKWHNIERSLKGREDPEVIAKQKAKKEIIANIAALVIKQGKPLYIADALTRYKQLNVANGGSMERIQAYTTQNLSKMMKNEFPESELNIKPDATKKMIAFKFESMSTGLAYEKAKFASGDTKNLMWECAMKMRQDILQLESIPLEEPLSVNSIVAGEAQVPDSVNEFLTTLYTGSSSNSGYQKRNND